MSTAPGRFAQHLASGASLVPGLPALLEPGVDLEAMAHQAREVTLQRFGRAVRLFAPLYVSNACLSSCTYCGFSKG
ncbi:MAG: thiazole biosynthesis protein ThiH, partial [Frankiales bacterium]|nr:thiazole biosynthesis protein ThiH [Frankiales bacterium]